jgi:Ras-related protein Rab-1A
LSSIIFLIYFLFLFKKYYRDAAGVLIVYDVTNAESFTRVRRWIDEINKYCDDNIVKILVGNKDDIVPTIQKDVSTEYAEQYARDMNLPFFETSAKDNKNVDATFYAVTRLALQQRLEKRKKDQQNNGVPSSQSIQLKGAKKTKKKNHESCCK